MDLSALAKAIAADGNWLDFVTPFLYVATAGVLVGLVIEIWPDFGKLHWHHWDNDTFLELFGGVVVTSFIAAELWVTFLAAKAETKLRSDTATYIAALEKEAGDANNKAAQANARAARLEKEAATEREHAALIERLTAWRHLTDAQTKGLSDALSKRPDITIAVIYPLNDDEAELFAGQFTKALPYQTMLAVTFSYFMPFGISIPPVKSTHDDVTVLRNVFTELHIPFNTSPIPTPHIVEGTLLKYNDGSELPEIVIGHKSFLALRAP